MFELDSIARDVTAAAVTPNSSQNSVAKGEVMRQKLPFIFSTTEFAAKVRIFTTDAN